MLHKEDEVLLLYNSLGYVVTSPESISFSKKSQLAISVMQRISAHNEISA